MFVADYGGCPRILTQAVEAVWTGLYQNLLSRQRPVKSYAKTLWKVPWLDSVFLLFWFARDFELCKKWRPLLERRDRFGLEHYREKRDIAISINTPNYPSRPSIHTSHPFILPSVSPFVRPLTHRPTHKPINISIHLSVLLSTIIRMLLMINVKRNSFYNQIQFRL